MTIEECESLWQPIIDNCNKQLNNYKKLNKKVNKSLQELNNIECSKCKEKIAKQYNDMLISFKQNITIWTNQKNRAIKSKENCIKNKK